MIDLSKLKAPFPKNYISWRVGATSADKTKAIALAYIDARDVMQRLDDVCGPQGWQALHPHANGKTSCKIGIKIGDEWVWKENGCGDSQVEADKGAFSDALKRAAVLWGVGRYLYDVPNVWVEIEPAGKSYKIKNQNDPKLLKALESAERGIRSEGEKEPEASNQVKPFTNDEKDIMISEISRATTLEQALEVQKKLTAAKPRMSEGQIQELGKELMKKMNTYSQGPVQ